MRSHSIFQEQKLLVPLLYLEDKGNLEQDIKELNAAFSLNIKKKGVKLRTLAFARAKGSEDKSSGFFTNNQVAFVRNSLKGNGTKNLKNSFNRSRYLLNSGSVNCGSTVSCAKLSLLAKVTKQQKWEAASSITQIILSFSSFEKKDLNSAFNLFQTFLTGLTNRLSTYGWFPGGGLVFPLPLAFGGKPKGKLENQKQRENPRLLQTFSTSYLKTFRPISKLRHATTLRRMSSFMHGSSSVGPSFPRKSHKDRIALIGVLKAVRALNHPLRATHIPLPTQLHTVIRSPHVFKKTREQFATTRYKKIVKLNFKSTASLRLLLDSLVLLKLPAEIKVTIKHL